MEAPPRTGVTPGRGDDEKQAKKKKKKKKKSKENEQSKLEKERKKKQAKLQKRKTKHLHDTYEDDSALESPVAVINTALELALFGKLKDSLSLLLYHTYISHSLIPSFSIQSK